MPVTSKQYGAMNQAYQRFNEQLFGNQLSESLLTLVKFKNPVIISSGAGLFPVSSILHEYSKT